MLPLKVCILQLIHFYFLCILTSHALLLLAEFDALYPCEGHTAEEGSFEAGQKVYVFQEDWLRGSVWAQCNMAW